MLRNSQMGSCFFAAGCRDVQGYVVLKRAWGLALGAKYFWTYAHTQIAEKFQSPRGNSRNIPEQAVG